MKQLQIDFQTPATACTIPCVSGSFEQEVPWGSYNFGLGFNEYDKLQTLQYDVKQGYAGQFGHHFGGEQKWSEDVDLPEGKWEIQDIQEEKVVLRRVG
jgi:hypothetical protein